MALVAILLLHLAGAALLLGSGTLGAGIGVTAYLLGLRHALDPDHIAAIDNATRKLTAPGRRPRGVGFFFALGHSSVVFALVVAVAAGVHGLGGAVADEGSALHQVTGVIGPLVAGAFLLAVAVANLVALARRRGPTGAMRRVAEWAGRTVSRPRHMYVVGLLFGVSFDTATEIALLATAGGAAAGGLPVAAILCLPLLFAAGMTLLDTIDGELMGVAYRWGLTQPARKRAYDTALTGLSVVAAIAIGTMQLAGA